MQHSSLQNTQSVLAEAVRAGRSTHLSLPPQRLAVYARLVRNNTFGFIDRCFVETQHHVPVENWEEVKEFFIQKGKATSPYFQDIAGEFLEFCKQNQYFSTDIIALMDFEFTQLLAEVSMVKVPEKFEWNQNTVMRFSGAAFVKEYQTDFLSSNFKTLDMQACRVIVWRDSQFFVLYQKLSELDFWLFNYLQEQTSSLSELYSALDDLVEDAEELKVLLYQTWINWINADVIYPA